MNDVVHGKCDRCHQCVKRRTTGRLTVDQKVKVVLFYVETKSVVATQRRFARGCEAKQWPYWTSSSLGTIFQPMRINYVPDVKCFCNNKNVICVQSMGMTFRAPRCIWIIETDLIPFLTVDGLSFPGLVWTFKLLPSKHIENGIWRARPLVSTVNIATYVL